MKEINYTFSIGSNCDSTFFIREYDLCKISGPFDWVYIDGDHTCSVVLKDLEFYFPLVKAGGFLCGDDYLWRSVDCKLGPKPAVDAFVKAHNLNLEVVRNQFVISK